ncbi:NACHT domain-containing NTPase [Nostoc sp. C052]|uniref:NACHT domain-containing protein n=1 Tax=Nostoc sp. C052 TaxID=2576902 RepID=UPI0015C3495A|nr:NACHT domain-containing NTPase [Nostoc sp. C052]QLE41988.1 NACHT domain-containing NTPase [Nostoc sp. C052]
MSGRSLSCSPEGIQKAKRALIRCSLTQKALAEDLEVTRQPIGKFFTGKPVDRNLFVQICDRLDLEWEEIVAELASEPQIDQDSNIDIDTIVQAVREKIKPLIQERCGTMRVLDMTQPIGLNDIYTSVNILEKIIGRQRLSIDELLQQYSSEDFDRFGLGRITQKRVPGLEAVEKYPKLIILGKPGAGKTTFLKYLAIQSIGGKFQAKRVPIFVTLKDFAEAADKPSLLEYISQQFSNCRGVGERQAVSLENELLEHGKALVLLDGLDEVREEDNSHVFKEIKEFSDDFQNNHFVISCRIAAQEYTFEKFTEVEVADFDDEQIATFATNWFKDKLVKPEIFIKRLEENNRIKQLAASPLLLTLLCLAFEESGDFPANRSELYKEGLDALLKKWDAKRGIQRYQIYKKLSVQRKEDLLSKIALTTFERSDYFFKQKAAEQYITEYIRNLPDANTDPEILQLESEVVLRSIEAQHGLLVERAKGIYSFSHLTFHEYFTAREIVIVQQSSEEALQNLVIHTMEKPWQEVFLLGVGMSPSADILLKLMKKHIDAIVVGDEKLQQFLQWVNQRSLSVQLQCKPAAIRAFYFEHDSELDSFRILSRAVELEFEVNYDLALTLACDVDDHLTLTLADGYEFNLFLTLAIDLARILFVLTLEPKMQQALQQIKAQLPYVDGGIEIFKQWWKIKGQSWIKQFRAVMIKYRNIGHDWQFSQYQKELLKQYYDSNMLLIECLNSDCYVSREVRQQIEDTLLLPIAEIKQRQQQS